MSRAMQPSALLRHLQLWQLHMPCSEEITAPARRAASCNSWAACLLMAAANGFPHVLATTLKLSALPVSEQCNMLAWKCQ